MTVQERALELVNKIAAELGIELDEFDAEAIAGSLARDIEANNVDTFNTIVAFDNVARNDFRAKRDELGEGDAEAGESAISGAMQQVFDDNPELTTPEDPAEPGTPEDLVAALAALQTANAGVATAAKALNDAAEDNDALTAGYEGSAAGVEAARTDAQAAVDTAQSGLTSELETTVADTTGVLYAATSKHLGSTQELTEANLNTAKAGVQAEINADETVLFLNEGGALGLKESYDLGSEDNDQLIDLSNETIDSSLTINLAELAGGNKNANGGGGSDTIILPKFSEITGPVTIENMIIGDVDGADYLVAEGLENGSTVTVTAGDNANERDAQGLYPYLNFELDSKVTFNNLINANTLFLSLVEAGELEVVDDGATVSLSALEAAFAAPAKSANASNDDPASGYQLADSTAIFGAAEDNPVFAVSDNELTGEDRVVTVDASGFANVLSATLDGASFVELLQGYGNLIAEEDVATNLESVGVTLADLQQQMQDAEAELASARDAKADADVLADITAAINAHLGAGGDPVALNGIEDAEDNVLSLIDLRTEINKALVDAGEDYELGAPLVPANTASDRVVELFQLALAGVAKEEPVIDGVVTIERAEAPTSGEGTWVKGEETAEDSGIFTFTYQPSAEEQALVDAIAAVVERSKQIVAEEQTKENFTKATVGEDDEALGAQLDAIETQLEVLAKAEEALTDALADQTAAEEVIGGLEAAVAEQDAAEQWFVDNGYELPVTAEGNVAGTVDNDIFLFDEEASADASIANFGAAGEDQLFFGEGFTLVALEDGESITDKVGDVATQEIFWEQNGNNVELYVENETFAGNGSSTADLTQVTLTGVTGADLQDNLENGTLVLGTAADIA